MPHTAVKKTIGLVSLPAMRHRLQWFIHLRVQVNAWFYVQLYAIPAGLSMEWKKEGVMDDERWVKWRKLKVFIIEENVILTYYT